VFFVVEVLRRVHCKRRRATITEPET